MSLKRKYAPVKPVATALGNTNSWPDLTE